MGGNLSTNEHNTEPTEDFGLLYSKLNFLLIGKTGNGKSACCNAIAGVPEDQPVFVSFGGSFSVTKTVGIYQIKRWGKEISVTDTPGLQNTDFDALGNARFAKKNMIKAMKICPEGFHAFVIVLSYGYSFCLEEHSVIEVLTEIFDDEMFQFAILIFTHGDDFDKDNHITNENSSQKMFKTWCEKQQGNLKTLLEKCNFRAVLCHNNQHYDGKRDAEMIELKKQTECIIQNGKLYTNENVQRCQVRRDHLVLNRFFVDLKEEINNSLQSLKIELELITSQEKKIIERIDSFLGIMSSTFPDLETLIVNLGDLKVTLQNEMKNHNKYYLYLYLRHEITTPLFVCLKSLSDDLSKVIKPEKHKEDLKQKAKALKNYIYEEDHGTGKLQDEMKQLNNLLTELNDLDTKT